MVHVPRFDIERVEKYPRIEDVVGKPREFIEYFLTNIEAKGVFEVCGINEEKTILLYGPPGTGKTFSVRALYNTANKYIYEKIQKGEKFDKSQLKLLLMSYDIGRYGTAYINMSSRILHSFFESAGLYAQYGVNTLIMLDEVDALLQSRKTLREAEDKKVLETLMKDLQIAHDTKNLYVIMISNMPELCDEASLRAGRVDKKIEFKLPDYNERLNAFEFFIKRVNKRANYKVITKYNLESLAEASEGYNYADIEQVVDRAVREKIHEIFRKKSKEIIKPLKVHQKDLESIIREIGSKKKVQFGFHP